MIEGTPCCRTFQRSRERREGILQGEALRDAAEKRQRKGVRNRFEQLFERIVRAEWNGVLDS